jgi:RNA recognition motif-containing protein
MSEVFGLFVGNVDQSVDMPTLTSYFQQYGPIARSQMKGRDTDAYRFAFFDFENEASRDAALKADGLMFGGRALKVGRGTGTQIAPRRHEPMMSTTIGGVALPAPPPVTSGTGIRTADATQRRALQKASYAAAVQVAIDDYKREVLARRRGRSDDESDSSDSSDESDSSDASDSSSDSSSSSDDSA